jgi:hypothetical protein
VNKALANFPTNDASETYNSSGLYPLDHPQGSVGLSTCVLCTNLSGCAVCRAAVAAPARQQENLILCEAEALVRALQVGSDYDLQACHEQG